jgi:light-regulated signal transduction histidine kinase (bacteriophytochrome)
VPLANTNWKLLLTVPTSTFFAPVQGFRHSLPWIIFAAFGIVAALALVLVRRSIRASDRLRHANEALVSSNVELSSTQASLKEAADALAMSNTALERSNDELERQARELVRSNTELDQFASIASHDLQEPLRKVRTFTERISETEASNLSERGADYLRRANASAERMQTLIEDLLRFSRVSTQGRPFSVVDLNAIGRDVLDDLSEQVERAGATVNVGPLPTINADPSQMRQLLQNLISNALKFQRKGVPSVVDVEATVDSGWMTMTVKDNGIGFDPQYSRRIFRVFERLHGRGTYPGTGIGLALCRKIAERHGGTIIAVGVPDEGATFTVTMQTERTEAVSDAPAPGRADDRNLFSGGPSDREEPYVTA